jgi:hypothetical protein
MEYFRLLSFYLFYKPRIGEEEQKSYHIPWRQKPFFVNVTSIFNYGPVQSNPEVLSPPID